MKKPYASPQIIRVQLNPEQAVLATCSIRASIVANFGIARDECTKPGGAFPRGCRKGTGNEDDGLTS